MDTIHQVPTHLFLGFLGTGKTSAILNYFTQKPDTERWVVLVNEFGKQGIDGRVYSNTGIFVKEISGGCLCCAAGVPFQVALVEILKTQKPDRLFIESSGASHAEGVINTLKQDAFKNALDLKATFCFIDPMHLLDPRYYSNDNFQAHIKVADILIANKTDLANNNALKAFDELILQHKADKTLITQTTFGQMKLDWLNLVPKQRLSQTAQIKAPKQTLLSLGWSYPETIQFDSENLIAWLKQDCFLRAKAIIASEKGWLLLNASGQQVTQERLVTSLESRIEIVIEAQNKYLSDELKNTLHSCLIKQ